MSSLPMILLLLGGGPAQQPDNLPDTKTEAKEASATAMKLTAEFVVTFDQSGKKVRLERPAEPVLRWTNHLGRRFYGDVYVWTHEGRPEVVASVSTIFTAKTSTYTEIHSLSTERPILSRGGKVVWEPNEPGVEFKPLPSAPKPGPTATTRRLQLRNLAAQFSVVADYGIDKEQKEALRLLGTPVYRYQSVGQGVVDGALFAFTKGTDPDTFLMIEARGKKNDAEWQFAFARFNGNCVLRATLKDKEVWHADRLPTKMIVDPKQPYFNFR
ncbi:MAG TPA: hypothetical protein VH575_01810 [Gemmataceae bacterium]